MLWELEIRPKSSEVDREAARVLAEAQALGAGSIRQVESAHLYLIEGEVEEAVLSRRGVHLLVDAVTEDHTLRLLPEIAGSSLAADPSPPAPLPEERGGNGGRQASDRDVRNPRSRIQNPESLNVLFKPGVTDNVGETARLALQDLGLSVDRVATGRKYWVNGDAAEADVARLCQKVLANDAIEHVIRGPLQISTIALGSTYRFELKHVAIRELDDDQLMRLSKEGQLYLQLAEMRTIRDYYRELGREPTDVELETIAQTWSEHCSHKTLAGRIAYRDDGGERRFENMLKETIFAATQQIRRRLGEEDWCVSVFKDNAGVVTFDDEYDVCFKVETHNHPSALEPYGGANTGLGGVIRDPLGTGLGAKPICNTDVFCFAPPETPYEALPPGVLHPKTVMRGVVSGVRDYGNRMGIPTVNGAVYFDERYLGNPLVYCGNVAIIPRGKSEKKVLPGDYIVAVGGRTGRDGIHGATFSSAELTHESEELSGGAVQIGNAITEKMLLDVVLQARDRNLFHAITDCGAGGFSSAVGEMGEQTGAEVWLEKAPLKYSGLSYTEIWISEAQERMVLAVPPENWAEFHALCAAEGVEATVIGTFTDTRRLVLRYDGNTVGELSMHFLHDGRPPVVREAIYQSPSITPVAPDKPSEANCGHVLKSILGSLNVCSKEWIIRQYDHEVQAGSVVKPLVGIANDGPSDAAVVRPRLTSNRGLVIGCGMNPRFGDLDPYWMAASAIDEAVRNCIAVGADPKRIAILDNFCWGNTERPETLGSLVRAALGCHDTALAFGTPFISGKDSLNNEFTHAAEEGSTRTISIPPSLLISALGQIEDIETAVTMDLKSPGNLLYLVGRTKNELGGSHYSLVTEQRPSEGATDGAGRLSDENSTSRGGPPRSSRTAESDASSGQGCPSYTTSDSSFLPPQVDFDLAPKVFAAMHEVIKRGLVRSCHDLSEGGLAVALAEMAFAGGLGVDASLDELAAASGIDVPHVLLFSESNTRFLVEVEPAHEAEFVEQMTMGTGIAPIQFGRVTNDFRVSVQQEGKTLLSEAIGDLKESWQRPLQWD